MKVPDKLEYYGVWNSARDYWEMNQHGKWRWEGIGNAKKAKNFIVKKLRWRRDFDESTILNW